MTKIKRINCVGCPKFCQKEDFSELKRLIKKYKSEGYDQIEFNCEAGKQIIKKLD